MNNTIRGEGKSHENNNTLAFCRSDNVQTVNTSSLNFIEDLAMDILSMARVNVGPKPGHEGPEGE